MHCGHAGEDGAASSPASGAVWGVEGALCEAQTGQVRVWGVVAGGWERECRRFCRMQRWVGERGRGRGGGRRRECLLGEVCLGGLDGLGGGERKVVAGALGGGVCGGRECIVLVLL